MREYAAPGSLTAAGMQDMSAAQASLSALATVFPSRSRSEVRTRSPATGVPSGRTTSDCTVSSQQPSTGFAERYTPSLPKWISGYSHSHTSRKIPAPEYHLEFGARWSTLTVMTFSPSLNSAEISCRNAE